MRMSTFLYLMIIVLFAGLRPADAGEMRGFWCDAWGTGFKTPEQTQQMVDFAGEYGFTDIFIEVRKRGDAYYVSSLEPRGSDLSEGYDPLADILAKTHNKDIRVHAWIMAYDAWTDSPKAPPLDPNHVYAKHPEWISLDNKGKKAYVGGRMYLDPGLPKVRDHITKVAVDIVTHYHVDGLFVDGLRYPNSTFGYNPQSIALFNTDYKRTGSPKPNDLGWCNWRREQVTKLAQQISQAVKKARPGVQVSAAGYWNQKETYDRFFQDWPGWLKAGYFDFAVPMVFVPKNVPDFIKQVDDELKVGNGKNVIIGQGAWRHPAATTNRHLRVIRGKGSPGFVLFDYVALSTIGKDGKCLADKLQIVR